MPRRTINLSVLPPEYKITAINNTGKRGEKGKGRIFLMPDTPLNPVPRLIGVRIKPIPRDIGITLLYKTLTATTWDHLKQVIRQLYFYGYDWTTYTIQNLRNPVELFVLKAPDGQLFINAVEHSKTPKRIVFYTSFPITQQMLALIIGNNITDTEPDTKPRLPNPWEIALLKRTGRLS